MEENIERAKVAPTPDRFPIDVVLTDTLHQIEILQARVKFIRKHREKLKGLPRPNFMSGELIDFDNLPHEQVVKVVRTIGGKWDKKPADGNTLHYEARNDLDGFKVRCYQGAPPPSCKIIEIEEHVPAQVIPATTRRVRKLVCLPEISAVIAHAAAKHEAQASPVPDSGDDVPF